jgi:hypothetical protein
MDIRTLTGELSVAAQVAIAGLQARKQAPVVAHNLLLTRGSPKW